MCGVDGNNHHKDTEISTRHYLIPLPVFFLIKICQKCHPPAVYNSAVFSVFTRSCNCHHCPVAEHVITPRSSPVPTSSHPSPPQPLATTSSAFLRGLSYPGHHAGWDKRLTVVSRRNRVYSCVIMYYRIICCTDLCKPS